MLELSLNDKYHYFLSTLKKCSSLTNHLPDEDFLCIVLEDLSVDVYACFSEANLQQLVNARYIINRDIANYREIRETFFSAEQDFYELLSSDLIKATPEWKQINSIADSLLKQQCEK